MNSTQFAAFADELTKLSAELFKQKVSAIPLKVMANPKFRPYFERVAKGGKGAPKLFKGGPPVDIPGVSKPKKKISSVMDKVAVSPAWVARGAMGGLAKRTGKTPFGSIALTKQRAASAVKKDSGGYGALDLAAKGKYKRRVVQGLKEMAGV